MPRERRKWTEAEDAILRDAVLKGGEGACDWHLIASCIPGRTNKDCRKRWHYKVAATVNKGPWEVAEDERLWAAVQEHGSRWALVAQVVKTRNGDQCSKRWYDALDPSIDHSPWTQEEDVRLLEAIDKHGRNWKAIVKAYFPRRTSLSAKNRYSLLIRKMEPKNKQSQSGTLKKASTKPIPRSLSLQKQLVRAGSLSPRFGNGTSIMPDEDRSFHSDTPSAQSSPRLLSVPLDQRYNTSNSNNGEHFNFGSPLMSPLMMGQHTPGGSSSYTPTPSECPPLSPANWSELTSTNVANSEASFPIETPPVSNEDMSTLFFNDLQLNSHLGQGEMMSHSLPLDQGDMSSISDVDYRPRSGAITPRLSNNQVQMNQNMTSDLNNTNSRVVTVFINSEISETVNSIVNQLGMDAGVSIAIHLE